MVAYKKKKRRATDKEPRTRKPAKKVPAKRPAKKVAAKRPAKKVPAKRPAKKVAAKRPAKKVPAKRPAKKVPAKRPAKKVVKRTSKQVKKTSKRLQKLERERQIARRKKTPQKRKKERTLNQTRREFFERLKKRPPPEKERFETLLDLARKRGETPPVDKRKRRIRSKENTGDQRVVTVEDYVTGFTLEDILYKVRRVLKKMSGRYTIWIAALAFSAMGERLVGYGNRVLQSTHADAHEFQTQGIESTGVFLSQQGMMEALEGVLLDLSDEDKTIVYLHWVKIMNYDRNR